MTTPTNRAGRRRYKKRQGRNVWVFDERNLDLHPEQMAKLITSAGLEQARREAEARAEDETRHAESAPRVGEESRDV